MPEALLTLADVLELHRGRIGRTTALKHLAAHPTYGGGPTHLRVGRKILFRHSDHERFVESFAACPAAPASKLSNALERKRSTSGERSRDGAYTRALELLTAR